MVGIIDKISLGQNDDNSLAGFDDLTGERLVELGMGFGGVNEEGADISFFDGGEGAQGGEFFDANFALAGLAKAGGVEDFESAAMEADFDAVDVACGALAGANESLLLLT